MLTVKLTSYTIHWLTSVMFHRFFRAFGLLIVSNLLQQCILILI